MSTLRRILQLTVLAIVFMAVSGMAVFLIEWWSGGRLERWRSAPLSGSVGDESIAIELATIPVVLAVLACWGVVRLFRLRALHNEVDDTFRPILTVVSGYGRFVLIVVAAIYLVLGHGWAAVTHLIIAVVMFAVFYRSHRARERAIHERFELEREEDDDESSDRVA